MTQLETLLQNNGEVQQFALAALRECDGIQQLAARCLEAMINACMSAQADEACGASYNERSEGRTNSRNGYRERGLKTTAGEITELYSYSGQGINRVRAHPDCYCPIYVYYG